MPLPVLTWPNIDRTRWQAIQQRVTAQGFPLDSDSGTAAAAHGVKLAWHYDEAAQTLTVRATAKNFYVSNSEIEKELKKKFADLSA